MFGLVVIDALTSNLHILYPYTAVFSRADLKVVFHDTKIELRVDPHSRGRTSVTPYEIDVESLLVHRGRSEQRRFVLL